MQLWHTGRVSHMGFQSDGQAPVGPSAVRANTKTFIAGSGFVECSTPRALELDEIPGIIADFRRASMHALDAGFDGVELHGAHGYLLDAFLRNGTNHRTDAYGGSGHLTEYGKVVARGAGHVAKLVDYVEDPLSELPDRARGILRLLIASLTDLDQQIGRLHVEIGKRAKEDPVARRLMSIPGVGPVTATAVTALGPAAESFAKGRDFAAWVGLTPRQHSTGGRQKLGATSKMGERTIRRLLTIGASSVVCHAVKRGAPEGSWLARILARKPGAVVITALANTMARVVWALVTKGEIYKAPVAMA